jgi:hypothetical protein
MPGLWILSTVLLTQGFGQSAQPVAGTASLAVDISVSKSHYLPGEVVEFDAAVTNVGDGPVILRGADARSGYLRFLVAGADGKFRLYSRPGPVSSSCCQRIGPGETYRSKAALLWNLSPEGRSASTAEYEDTHLMTYLAFPEPGQYQVKAVLHVPGAEEGAKLTFESAPVAITVDPPPPVEVPVWEAIRSDPDIAYFIQLGELNASPSGRPDLLKELGQLCRDNPRSRLAAEIKRRLTTSGVPMREGN